MKTKPNSSLLVYLIIFLGIIFFILFIDTERKVVDETPYLYSDLLKDMNDGNIDQIVLYESQENPSHIEATVKIAGDDKTKIVDVPSKDAFMLELNNTDIKPQIITNPVNNDGLFESLLVPLILFTLGIVFVTVLMQGMNAGGGGGGASKAMSFGKSKARLTVPEKNKTTFDNVAGLQEEKVELAEIVDFLKNPKKYTDLGARIPKGILLVGPPGTGKTLLARAVAGEAKSPFFSISGSDFVEMFVGVGASRVRDLFETAKKNSPCLIFIDEIDAVGRKRGSGMGGGHDEREQTLNQLLVEMDGFAENEGIIILAATNRADILDPALLRPGRFDRQVVVGRPDVRGREEILKVHAKTKKVAEEVDLKVVAQTTSGFTGADLENLLNEAALISARHNLPEITLETIRKAFIKVGLGTEKKSRLVTEKERKITAYHEAGHAILFEVMSELDPVHIVSIIPTGVAGGYTMPLPTGDNMYQTKTLMEQEIMSLLAGRVAEKITFNEITTGASNDIERATKIARAMITQFGMNDSLGPVQYSDEHGHEIQNKIDSEVSKMLLDSMAKVEDVLKKYDYVLESSAQLLLEKEKISGSEFRELFKDGDLIEKEALKIFKDTFLDVELADELDNIELS